LTFTFNLTGISAINQSNGKIFAAYNAIVCVRRKVAQK